ncbi:MAG: beta-galactosidase, partial [Clostridia bacterium]|nr:beta-galactosidase [Clostridia bacterium]
MGAYLLGSSYYPEWWSEEEWKKDFAKMADLGLNSVRMGEFAWSWYEPREGEFNFEPMQRAVEMAAKEGIQTIMCTTTAVCPPWLYKKYPDVKGGNDNGLYGFGGRKGNCLSSEHFIEYALRITEEQAKVFARDKNVIAWQLDNEPGFPFVCYDPCCEKKFQKFLQKRYGTIDALNQAWFTMMWSNVYNDFDEIRLPVNAAEGGWSPGMKLDYRRFFSANFNELLSAEAKIIRAQGTEQFIFTNWPGANWSVSCEDAMSYLDYSAWDNYVSVPVGDDYRVQLRSSMEHDLCRRLSNGKQRFLIAEQCAVPHANTTPEAVRAQTWLDVAHGAFGNIFFEFRTPTGGPEQNYGSILRPDGSYNRAEHVIRKLAKDLDKAYDLIDGAETVSDVAAVYSYQNSWATPGWVVDGPYDEDFFRAHGAFKNALQTNVDVIFPSDELSKYRVVVAPNLMILSDAERENFEQYVRDGGVLVINTVADTRDATNLILEKPVPGLFNGGCGATMDAMTGGTNTVRYADGSEHPVSGTLYTLKAEPDVEIAAVYTADNLAGQPAVTVKQIGKGTVVLYASDSRDYRTYEALARVANRFAKVEPLMEVPDGVIISERKKGDDRYLIAVNAKQSNVTVNFPAPVYDVVNDRELQGEVLLEGFDALFVKRLYIAYKNSASV